MFVGSQHCSHCGAKTVPAEAADKKAGDCPRCKIKLNSLQIQDINLLECQKCGGFWSDAETFENICAEKEQQAKVLFFVQNKHLPKNSIPINYVPCPDCKQLMNRSNFARSSGVIIDICKQHGVWFDAEELPKIIEFIRLGGLDRARQKEKIELQEQKRDLIEQQRKIALENRRFQQANIVWDEPHSLSIRGFIKLLFD
jgi:Zn-finger nucleic acid-binding protein